MPAAVTATAPATAAAILAPPRPFGPFWTFLVPFAALLADRLVALRVVFCKVGMARSVKVDLIVSGKL